MRYANFKEEKKLWQKGFRVVVGIDEVGRGPLAGPVVACAVSINLRILSLSKDSLDRLRMSFPRLRDSKKLSPQRREEIYAKISNHPGIQWGIGIVSEKLIDKINIFQATKLAMMKAFLHVQAKLQRNPHITKSRYSKKMLYIDFVIVDGNMKLDLPVPYKAIVRGDEKVFSCALASIIAKVTRDRMMMRYHKKYPQYGFNAHKGYGTLLHIKNLKKYGPSSIHRYSFAPVRVSSLRLPQIML